MYAMAVVRELLQRQFGLWRRAARGRPYKRREIKEMLSAL
jgi:hypothetical protein